LTDEVSINTKFHPNEISPQTQFRLPAKCNFPLHSSVMPRSGSSYLVSEVSVQHIDTMFRDQAIQVDGRSQLCM